MKKPNKKTLLMLAFVSTLFVASFAIVYAESISTVVSAILQRVTISFEGIGQNKVAVSENDMGNLENETRASINGIVNKAEDDLSRELDEYKNMRVNEKKQELESLLKDVDALVEQERAEKLDEYKQKIDEKIDKEYEKLLNDLKLN